MIIILTKDGGRGDRIKTKVKASGCDDVKVVSPSDCKLYEYHDCDSRLQYVCNSFICNSDKHYFILHGKDIYGSNPNRGLVESYCNDNRIVYIFHHQPGDSVFEILRRDPFTECCKLELINLLENAKSCLLSDR